MVIILWCKSMPHPKILMKTKPRQRLLDAVTATLQVTGIETNKLILKVRQKQKA